MIFEIYKVFSKFETFLHEFSFLRVSGITTPGQNTPSLKGSIDLSSSENSQLSVFANLCTD